MPVTQETFEQVVLKEPGGSGNCTKGTCGRSRR